MTTVIGRSVEVVELGPDQLPVLAGPAATRLLAQVNDEGWQPRQRDRFAADSVVAHLAGSPAQRWARVLAERSGRRCLVLANPREIVGDGQATLVATADEIDDDLIAACAAANGGSLLVARSLARLSALVARTLRQRPARAHSGVHVDAIMGGATRPTLAGVRLALAGGTGVLGLRGHGRACMVNLDDGVICGAGTDSEPEPSPTEPSPTEPGPPRPGPSCRHGEGCLRQHWTGDRLLRGEDLGAEVVVLDSCQVQKIADARASLPLSILDGDAVAVIGSPWLRNGAAWSAARVEELLAAGVTLGAAVAQVNRSLRAEGALGEYVLFGDGGLRLAPAPGAVARASGQPASRPPAASQPASPRPASGQPADPALAAVAREVGELGSLTELGLLPEEQAQQLRAATLRAHRRYRPATDELSRQLRAAVAEAVEELISRVSTSFFQFPDLYLDDSVLIGETPRDCPDCGRRARAHELRHLVSGRHRTLVACHECGEVLDEQPGSPGVRVTGPAVVARGGRVSHEVVLTNPGPRAMVGHLGYAMSYGENNGFVDVISQPFDLPAGQTSTVALEVVVPADFGMADRQTMQLLVVTPGSVTVYSRHLWVVPRQGGQGNHVDITG